MGVNFATRRALMGGSYTAKVLGMGPAAYWPLNELNGTTAYCLTDARMNGTYARNVATMGTGAGIGDGNTAPLFDGVNDYANVNVATLINLWDAGGAECSVAIWARVSAVGVWTDAAFHGCYRFRDSANDYVLAQKTNVNNQFQMAWTSSGTLEQSIEAGLTTIAWEHIVMTRSTVADEVRYYRNGALLETDTVLGAWASATPWEGAVIGAVTVVPNAPWSGYLAHCAVWFRPLGAGEIADLAIV